MGCPKPISNAVMEVLCCLPPWPITAKISLIRIDTGIADIEPLLEVIDERFGVRRGRGKSVGIPKTNWAKVKVAAQVYWDRTRGSATTND